jgi:transposase
MEFAFDDFASAWEILAGVTASQLEPERAEAAKTAVRKAMWPNGDGPRPFRNETHFRVSDRITALILPFAPIFRRASAECRDDCWTGSHEQGVQQQQRDEVRKARLSISRFKKKISQRVDLRSGAPWRDLPQEFGPYTTCYNRFVRWRRAGVWTKVMSALAGAHDAAVQMIDTSIVRVHQHGACITRNRRQSMGRSPPLSAPPMSSDKEADSLLRRGAVSATVN